MGEGLIFSLTATADTIHAHAIVEAVVWTVAAACLFFGCRLWRLYRSIRAGSSAFAGLLAAIVVGGGLHLLPAASPNPKHCETASDHPDRVAGLRSLQRDTIRSACAGIGIHIVPVDVSRPSGGGRRTY